MVKFLNVTKDYNGTRALDNISFEIDSDKITGVIGHNGAGKTTLFMIANGLVMPSSGNVIIDNYSLAKNRNRIQLITGLFTDKLHLYNLLTVKECLNYFLQLFGSSKCSHMYTRFVDEFRLSSFENKRISELSTGMLKKVQLVVSIVNKPKVLFLDEPFSGLDPEARLEFGQILRKIRTSEKIQIFISSHDLLELELVIDNLLILKNGKLIANSILSDLVSSYFKDKEIIVEILSPSENSIQKTYDALTEKYGQSIERPVYVAENLYRFTLSTEAYTVLINNLSERSQVISIYDNKPSLDDLYFKISK